MSLQLSHMICYNKEDRLTVVLLYTFLYSQYTGSLAHHTRPHDDSASTLRRDLMKPLFLVLHLSSDTSCRRYVMYARDLPIVPCAYF